MEQKSTLKKKVLRWTSLWTTTFFFTLTLFPHPVLAQVLTELPTPEIGEDGSLNYTTLGTTRVEVNDFDQAAHETWNWNLGAGDVTVIVNGGDPTTWEGITNIYDGLFLLENIAGLHLTGQINSFNGAFIGSALPLADRSLDALKFGSMENDLTGGYVLNEGVITGESALIGRAVENRGIIDAFVGEVVIGAGDYVTLGISGNNLISIAVDKETAALMEDFEGNQLTDQIQSEGTLAGGKVTLHAKAIDGFFDRAINLEGEVRANALVEGEDGILEFVATGNMQTGAALEAEVIDIEITGDFKNTGEIHADTLTETAASFEISGVYDVRDSYHDNEDQAITYSGNTTLGSMGNVTNINDDENIIIEDGVKITLAGDVNFKADNNQSGVGRVMMGQTSEIDGDGNNLGFFASETSLLGIISEVENLSLNSQTVGGATYRLLNRSTLSGDLEVNTDATLVGGYSMTVGGGDVTGDGVINMLGGVFTVIGDGNFGGSQDWTFGTLQFGDGTTEGKTQKNGSNDVTVLNELNILLKHTLGAGSNNWNLSWGGGYLSDVIQVAGAFDYTLALLSDNTVMAWGNNDYGQLGNGTTDDSFLPMLVSGLTDVSAVAVGGFHSMALLGDGTVMAWGRNNYGQLGDGSTTTRMIPTVVSGLSGIAEIAAGQYFSLGRLDDGTVKAWGQNIYGQLGDGNGGGPSDYSTTPVNVSTLNSVVEIAAGHSHALARLSDGTVQAWGRNNEGQLGNGTTTNLLVPNAISGLTNVSEVAAGRHHSLARLSDGTVQSWGDNAYGQLGDGTIVDRLTPVAVSSLAGASGIAAGQNHSLAKMEDGTVKAWGHNFAGQLGDGNGGDFGDYSSEPVDVSNLSNVFDVHVAAGNNSFAILEDGSLKGWGNNRFGSLGDGTNTIRLTPVSAKMSFESAVLLSDISQVVSGENYTLALKSDGSRVYGWGSNSFGQLGNGTLDLSLTPTEVLTDNGLAFLTDVSEIAAGGRHGLALLNDGTVQAWGNNTFGQLGDSTTDSRLTAGDVTGLSDVLEISAGGFHSLARISDGTVKAWGLNNDAQLGDGSTTSSSTPVNVILINDAVEIAAGGTHSLARLSNGSVMQWGGGEVDEGDDSYINPSTAINSGAVSIAAGGDHSVALLDDGTIVSWWGNGYGQLGLDPDEFFDAYYYSPESVSGVSDVAEIAGGGDHSLVRLDDGDLLSWGRNNYGQLGGGSDAFTSEHINVLGLDNVDVLQISAGDRHSAVVLSDGTVKTWGYNSNGELGNNSVAHSSTPVDVRILSRAPFVVDGTFEAEQSTFLYNGGAGFGNTAGEGAFDGGDGEFVFGSSVGVTVLADVQFNNLVLQYQLEDYRLTDSALGTLRQPTSQDFDQITTGEIQVLGTQRVLPKVNSEETLKLLRDQDERLKVFWNELFGAEEGVGTRNIFEIFEADYVPHELDAGEHQFNVDNSGWQSPDGRGLEDFKKQIFAQVPAEVEPERIVEPEEAEGKTVLEDVEGDIRVVTKEGEILQAEEGMVIEEGDQIWTDGDAKAEMKTESGVVEIGSNTAVQVAEEETLTEGEMQKTLLQLAMGNVLVKVKETQANQSEFVVKVPSLSSGVRA